MVSRDMLQARIILSVLRSQICTFGSYSWSRVPMMLIIPLSATHSLSHRSTAGLITLASLLPLVVLRRSWVFQSGYGFSLGDFSLVSEFKIQARMVSREGILISKWRTEKWTDLLFKSIQVRVATTPGFQGGNDTNNLFFQIAKPNG